MMDLMLADTEKIDKVCNETEVAWGIDALESAFRTLMPELNFKHVVTRGNWHRPGGVVDNDYQSINKSLEDWAQQEAPDGDVDNLIVNFMDSGYFATRVSGKTHYFTAAYNDKNMNKPDDFIQLEVEELQEVLERPLIDRDWFPDSLEEFIDPLDYPRLEPEPIGKPVYHFRRITPIFQVLNDSVADKNSVNKVKRFFRDWQQCSASEGATFCHHWIMALREYKDSDGEARLGIKPVSAYAEKLPELPPGESLGADLANAIHSYDRQLGYPFAWYFIMLSSKASNYKLAEAVLKDQMGAYDYLPASDLKVLRQWEERPYGV